MAKTDKKKLVEECYQSLIEQTSTLRRKWLTCAAFARGYHYGVIDPDSNSLRFVAPPNGMQRSKINKIRYWKRHMKARLTLPDPDFEIIPSDTTVAEEQLADFETALVQHTIKHEWLGKKLTLASYLLDFGNAFFYLRDMKDKNNYSYVTQKDQNGNPILDDYGEPIVEKVETEGIELNVLKPHNVLCDSNDTDLQDKPFIILAFSRTKSYFKETYDEKLVDKMSFKDVQLDNDSWSLQNLSVTQSSLESTPEAQQIAIEKIYIENPKNDNARVYIVAGGVLLKDYAFPYTRMRSYPLVHVRWDNPESGEYWSDSPILDQIPLQRDMNKIASIIMENISMLGPGKWLNPNGSGVDSITDFAGQIINYNPGLPPHQAQIAPLPSHLANHYMILGRDLEDIQALHSVSKGQGQTSVRSAIGLNKLEEEDQTPLNVPDALLQESYEKLARLILQLGSEVIQTPKRLTYIKGGRVRKFANFKGSVIDYNSEITVRMKNKFLRYRRSAQEFILEMARHGLITNSMGKPDHTKVQKMLDFALPDLMFDAEEKQRNIAFQENEDIIAGDPVFAEEWEHHLVHIDVHEEFMTSREWKRLRANPSEETKRIVQAFAKHRQEHKIRFAQALGMKQPAGQGQKQNKNTQKQKTSQDQSRERR